MVTIIIGTVLFLLPLACLLLLAFALLPQGLLPAGDQDGEHLPGVVPFLILQVLVLVGGALYPEFFAMKSGN